MVQYSECPYYSEAMSPTPTIAPTELDRVIHAHGDLRILDVRTPGEFETGHIAGAYTLPLGDLTDVIDELREVTDRIVVVCQSGARADQACHALQEAGLDDIETLAGGMTAWQAAGLPVRHLHERWAMDRQVRLAAGSIVATAVLTSVWRPAARFVAGAVGGGLVFSALTNTCGMAAVLARLPYNRPRHATNPASVTAQRLRDGLAA